MNTSIFWKRAAERAGKTFAQTLLSIWGVGVFDVLHTNYLQALGVAGGATLLSVLSSVASSTVSDSDSPSVVK